MKLFKLNKEKLDNIFQDGRYVVAVCGKCSGVKTVSNYISREVINDPDIAYEVALMQEYEEHNGIRLSTSHNIEPCNCTCNHDFRQINDDGWTIKLKCKKCGEKVSRAYK